MAFATPARSLSPPARLTHPSPPPSSTSAPPDSAFVAINTAPAKISLAPIITRIFLPYLSRVTARPSKIVTLAAAAALAKPPSNFPASTVPPGTCRTTRNFPESVHKISDLLCAFFRPSSQVPWDRKSQRISKSRKISSNPNNTSPSSGKSPPAVSASVIPPVRPLAPAPILSASTNTIFFPGAMRPSQAAADNPLNPPPITTKSARAGTLPRPRGKFHRHGDLPHLFLKGLFIAT